MTDTAPEMRRLHHEMLMRRTPEERLRMASGMFDTARQIVLSSLPSDLPEAERRIALIKRFYGRDLDPEFMQVVARTIRESA